MSERNAPLGRYREELIPPYPVVDSWVNREEWLSDIKYCLKQEYVYCHQCKEWVRKKYYKQRGSECAGCHWWKKCRLCAMYGYNKRVEKRLCHVIVDGKVKRLGEVTGNPNNLPALSRIMPGVVLALDLPKIQLGMTSAENEYQVYLSS